MGKGIKRQNDWTLIATVFMLSAFGLVMVYSASYVFAFDRYGDHTFFFKRQLFWFVVSTSLFLLSAFFPYRLYQKFTQVIVPVCIILLLLVLTPLGVTINGSTRWIDLKFMNFQPSEFVKLGTIIYLSHVYSRKQAYINQFARGVIPPLIVVGIFFSFIMYQPDLGTASLILAVAGLIVFCSGAKFIHLAMLATVCGSIVTVYAFSADYRLARLTGFLDPFADPLGSGYQLIQSYVAIAHGGLTGAGFGQSVQKLLYLPEAHTDFILSIIAEELGIIGVLFVLGSLGIIVFRGILIGLRCKDSFGSLLAFGICFQIAIQVCLNVGAASGVLPITGIPLPFLSYGGSSLMITFISMGILVNIARLNSNTKEQISPLREAS